MTLLDFPGRVACTVFLGGCDFRCPFCHNYELVDGTMEPVMDEEELFAFLSKRKGLLDGVVFTGGEPALRPELPGLCAKIREMGFLVKLDTNGSHPDMLRRLIEEDLVDYVAMDIKNSPEKYAETCGVDFVDMERIYESIRIIKCSAPDYEFRTTVVDEFHESSDFEKIGEMIKGAGKYFLQPFTDRETVPYGDLHAPSKQRILDYAAAAAKYVPETKVRGLD